MSQTSARPTNKWLAALVTGLGTIAVMALTTGTWDTEESVALVGLVVERTVSYLTPNVPPVLEGDSRGDTVILLLVAILLVAVLILAGVHI